MSESKIREYSIPLFAGILAAMLWVNIDSESYNFIISKPIISGSHISLHYIVNEGFMVLFFGMAGAELVRSFREGGELYPIKNAINPLMATLGGIVGPVIIFFSLNHLIGDASYIKGWGMCTATDIALAWLLARVVFGRNHAAVKFLLLLAIADDGIGLLIIAVFYSDPAYPVEPIWLFLVLLAMGLANIFRKAQVNNFWAYLLIPGMLCWMAMVKSHLHPVLAFVFIVPFIPDVTISSDGKERAFKKDVIITFLDTHFPTIKAKREQEKRDGVYNKITEITGEERKATALEKFEKFICPIVDYGLFFFGLTNAGVEINQINNLTFIILSALVLGKMLGISTLTFLADKLGFKKPRGMKTKDVWVLSMIGSLGLTVALFIADIGFADVTLRGSAKMGALFSGIIFLVVPIIGKVLKIEKDNNDNTNKNE